MDRGFHDCRSDRSFAEWVADSNQRLEFGPGAKAIDSEAVFQLGSPHVYK